MANNPQHTHDQDVKFSCKDAGHPNCSWEARGHDEKDVMQQVEKHGREAHGINNIDQQTRDRVKQAIRPAA
jgi:predicted small metal-binding protein